MFIRRSSTSQTISRLTRRLLSPSLSPAFPLPALLAFLHRQQIRNTHDNRCGRTERSRITSLWEAILTCRHAKAGLAVRERLFLSVRRGRTLYLTRGMVATPRPFGYFDPKILHQPDDIQIASPVAVGFPVTGFSTAVDTACERIPIYDAGILPSLDPEKTIILITAVNAYEEIAREMASYRLFPQFISYSFPSGSMLHSRCAWIFSDCREGQIRCDLFVKPVSRRKEAFIIEFKVTRKLGELEAKAENS